MRVTSLREMFEADLLHRGCLLNAIRRRCRASGSLAATRLAEVQEKASLRFPEAERDTFDSAREERVVENGDGRVVAREKATKMPLRARGESTRPRKRSRRQWTGGPGERSRAEWTGEREQLNVTPYGNLSV